MRRPLWSLVLLSITLWIGCGSPSGPTPKEFALEVARCVAGGDWPAYRELVLARAQTLAGDANPTGTRRTFQKLTGLEEDGIRRDFERAVRARVVSSAALGSCTAVIHATEPDRWVVHIHDGEGKFTGLEMTLVRHGDGYRLATLSAR